MNRTKKSRINAVLLVITLIINFMGAMGMINGNSQKEVSDQYFTLITPAPITFSIWGLIYTLLIVSIIVMILKKSDVYYQKAVDEISELFWISCLTNIAWVISFSYLEIGTSVVFILLLLTTLLLILQRVSKIHDGKRKHFLLPLTFGLYAGWIFIATIVNIAAWLVKIEWSGFGIPYVVWAISILIIAIALVYTILSSNKNAAFPLPVAWAYFGIFLSLKSLNFRGEYDLLQYVALAGMIVLIVIAAIQFYRNKNSILP